MGTAPGTQGGPGGSDGDVGDTGDIGDTHKLRPERRRGHLCVPPGPGGVPSGTHRSHLRTSQWEAPLGQIDSTDSQSALTGRGWGGDEGPGGQLGGPGGISRALGGILGPGGVSGADGGQVGSWGARVGAGGGQSPAPVPHVTWVRGQEGDKAAPGVPPPAWGHSQGHRMASPQLTSVLAAASAATSRGLEALVGLANALGKPEKMPEAREEAEEAAAEAEEALKRLNEALAAALSAKAVEEPGVGARRIYEAMEAFAKARVKELEREQKQNQRQKKLLVVLRNVALGLLLLCTPLLSFDAVREALGVTQEGHLVPCLATVLLLCQVAAWATERSGHHLATALEQQRHQLARYRHRAHAAAAARPDATRAALGTLEEVANQLQQLLGALEDDLQEARGFPATTRALGTAAVALGTATQDEEGLRRLARVLPGEVAGRP